MFRKVGVPILGVIENMALHTCSQCGHTESIFGADGGERIASEYGVTLLASLPLERAIREQTDSGNPTVVAAPDSAAAQAYLLAAAALAAGIGDAPPEDFPTISISDD